MSVLGFTNEQGHCPKCDSTNLDYGAVRFEDGEMCYFPYACNDCKQEGEEWYKLSFEGHNVYTENGDLVEL